MPHCNVIFIRARIEWENKKALRAMRRVAELAEEIAEDMPWSETAKELASAARYSLRHVQVDCERIKK